MIKQFVDLLRKKISEERVRITEIVMTRTGQKEAETASYVARNITLREVEQWIEELYKVDADDLKDEGEPEPALPLEKVRKREKRRERRAGPWGTE